MVHTRKIVLIGVLFIVFCTVAVIGCKKTQDRTRVQKAPAQQGVQALDPAAQEAFKKKLADLGVPMYKGATFVEVKRKAKDSPMLVSVYEVPAPGKNDYDKVKAFYSAGLKKALVPKGWAAAPAAENVILYRKGFEIFYTEFSQLIIPPDTKKILVSFSYGK